ncbi:gamma-glutamyltransferase [Cupriavidus plantarum]|uniref:gamma-glutamyltransferase n=1 Tax=Cupriavidus plantarum TaxID=942865 RepID=UPI000EB57674|nr:gamma-glutamyltransferase [Cupriavidus plantarum]RLK28767.1 gamma-glutamyltranspeptidase/glutathione hydrolase [Cupriavidus plantarum]
MKTGRALGKATGTAKGTALGIALAMAVAGCGGDSDPPPTGSTGGTTPPATPSDPATPVRSVKFDPSLCTQQAGAPYGQTVGITGTNMMVTSADVNASASGCKVLANGGTAIDAAIAVQAVLGVAEPFASGIGGGTVITYYDGASKQVRTFDGFSSSPANTGGVADIYKATAQDVSTTAPYNLCKTGLVANASISSQQGNTNISARAVGVPGTLAVLDMVHNLYGKTAWNKLWDDAIQLATDGFPMTPYMYETLYSDSGEYDDDGNPVTAGTGVSAWVNSAGTAKGAPRCKYPDINARYCDPADATRQKPLPVGTLIKNPELAASMTTVRDGGAAAFYDPAGTIAPAIITKLTTGQLPCYSLLPAAGTAASPSVAGTVARIPSLMTAADFGAYRAVERKPLVGTRFGFTIYTQPSPSFGGVVQLYNLGLLERKNVAATAFNGTDYLHLVTEGSRLANADRRNIVGDPAFSNVNARVNTLLSSAYLDTRAALIATTALATVPTGGTADGIAAFAATDPTGYDTMASVASVASTGGKVVKPKAVRNTMLAKSEAPLHAEDWNTTSNVAIVDGYGNALSMTTTINTHWGAHIEAAGIMINNAMSNFSASTPGLDVNGYAANKRPRSSISPSIAFDAQGRIRLVWGSAGGGPIPDYIVKTFLGHEIYGMDLQAAINADNFTGQNGLAQLEAGKPIASQVANLISTYGNTAANAQVTGLTSGLSGISVSYDGNGFPVYSGAADNRRNGAANGY